MFSWNRRRTAPRKKWFAGVVTIIFKPVVASAPCLVGSSAVFATYIIGRFLSPICVQPRPALQRSKGSVSHPTTSLCSVVGAGAASLQLLCRPQNCCFCCTIVIGLYIASILTRLRWVFTQLSLWPTAGGAILEQSGSLGSPSPSFTL